MKKTSRFTLLYLLLALLALFFIQRQFSDEVYELTYNEFKEHLKAGHVVWVEVGSPITGKMEIKGENTVPRPQIPGFKVKPRELPKNEKPFTFTTPYLEDPTLVQDLEKHKVN